MAPAPSRNRPERFAKQTAIAAVLLLVLPFIAYFPAITGEFIWDDNVMLTDNPYIKASDGLRDIWFSTKLTDYLPLTSSSFWLEWRVWGMNPAGYRITNLLLHSSCALLLWRLLLFLKIPGAWLAAAIFSLHPVCIASVAWIAERKNTLSLVFYLLAVLAYLTSQQNSINARRNYVLALAAFLCALLSKSAVVMLPVVLLTIALWQNGQLTRRDFVRTAPFFTLSLAFGLLTIWFQFHRSLGEASADTLSWPAKAVAATWAIWFYAWKAVWPLHLSMIYPSWSINLSSLMSYVPLLALAGAAILFWRFRRTWGRHALMAMFYFIISLLPVLGFIDMYFLNFSRVADHWQYVAVLGIIVPVAGFIGWKLDRGSNSVRVVPAIILLGLAGLTWRQASTYKTSETLWKHTLSLNPNCWPAHNNLGRALDETSRTEEAIAHYRQALRLHSKFSKTHYNLAVALEKTGNDAEAAASFTEALRLEPRHVISMNHLGNIRARQGKTEEAIAHYKKALSIQPDFAEVHNNLANVLSNQGNLDKAIEHYRLALLHQPIYPEAHNNLAYTLQRRGETEAAIDHYRKALELKPAYTQAQMNLATLLLSQGRLQESKHTFQSLLKLQSIPEAHYNLALIWIEEGAGTEAEHHLAEALRLKPDFVEARRELDALSALK